MQVVTITTDIHHRNIVTHLRPSCKFNNLELIILDKEKSSLSSYRHKDTILEEYLCKIDPEEIIFFSDANDTMFLSSEEEIMEKYKNFNTPLVFSAEINCWPDLALRKEYINTNNHFNFLNTGGFIGKAGYILELYKKYPVFDTALGPFDWSNQYYWHHIYFKENNTIKIDHNCSIFYNTAILIENMKDFKIQLQSRYELDQMLENEKKRLTNEIAFEKNRIFSKITNSFPCHLHFPGPISKMLNDIGFFSSISFNY